MDTNPGSTEQRRVLVVEDDEYARDVLKGVVTRLGHTPIEAANVPKALSILKDEPINLMLLDIYLKGATGLDLLKTLQRRKQHVPTVVVSGHISDAVAHQLIEFGVQGLVSKPFSLHRVAAEIHKVIPPAGDLPGVPPLNNAQDQAANEPVEVPVDALSGPTGPAEDRDRRSGRRIRMKLPIRARAGGEKHFYMRLLDISHAGMQTHAKNLEILKMGSASEGFQFEIPVVARLARINSRHNVDEAGGYSIGWEFDRIIQLYADPSADGLDSPSPEAPGTFSELDLRVPEGECFEAVPDAAGKRRDLRINVNLPIRAKVGNGRNLEMRLADISSTGMQTVTPTLEILELKHVSATQQFVFEIPLRARLAWIHSRSDETFAMGWEFQGEEEGGGRHADAGRRASGGRPEVALREMSEN